MIEKKNKIKKCYIYCNASVRRERKLQLTRKMYTVYCNENRTICPLSSGRSELYNSVEIVGCGSVIE